MKNFRSLSVILLACMLVACGPSKKADQGKNGNGLGKTGQGQGDGSGGGGGDNRGPANPPQSFEQWCTNTKHGQTYDGNICKYVWKTVNVSLPENPPNIFRVTIAPVHEGMSVQAKGDSTGAGMLFLVTENRREKIFDIIDRWTRARLVSFGSGVLQFESTAKFTQPAEIMIFECQSPEHTFNNCPAN